MIDEMTEMEAKSLLNDISDVFGIGAAARTSGVILNNAQNAVRRSSCLSRIESHLITTEFEDGETVETCPLKWGDGPDEYLERFKQARGDVCGDVNQGMGDNLKVLRVDGDAGGKGLPDSFVLEDGRTGKTKTYNRR